MSKSPDAFRTISEVAETLDTPAHVLRFWESKFRQIKPVKRAGGRRYYRPDDVALLASIKTMLHSEGHSIKNAQKMIRDAGIKEIVAKGHALLGSDNNDSDIIEGPASKPSAPTPANDPQRDLFEAEAAAPAPSLSDAIHNTPPAAAAVTAKPLPDIPSDRSDGAARLLASLTATDPARITANKAQIRPLVDKLAALRDEMQHPW